MPRYSAIIFIGGTGNPAQPVEQRLGSRGELFKAGFPGNGQALRVMHHLLVNPVPRIDQIVVHSDLFNNAGATLIRITPVLQKPRGEILKGYLPFSGKTDYDNYGNIPSSIHCFRAATCI